jgi:hypothetical protein
MGCEPVFGFVQGRLGASEQSDGCAVLREAQGNALTEAAAGASDDGDFSM